MTSHEMESVREINKQANKESLTLFCNTSYSDFSKSLPQSPGIPDVLDILYFDLQTPFVYHDYFFQLDSIAQNWGTKLPLEEVIHMHA